MPLHWGHALATLVSSCWAQDPDYRPSAREVGILTLADFDQTLTLPLTSCPGPLLKISLTPNPHLHLDLNPIVYPKLVLTPPHTSFRWVLLLRPEMTAAAR